MQYIIFLLLQEIYEIFNLLLDKFVFFSYIFHLLQLLQGLLLFKLLFNFI